MTPDTKNKDASGSPALMEHTHAGAMLGILFVALIIIFGGLYLWGALIAKNEEQARMERTIPNNEPETTRAETDREIMNTTSSSNDLDAIYADLESTNLNDLDTEFNQIDAEMGTSVQ